jgi:hypothetical protein
MSNPRAKTECSCGANIEDGEEMCVACKLNQHEEITDQEIDAEDPDKTNY